MRISILIPTYNEQDTIVTVLQRVTAVEVPEVEFEVIVIDDGSSDDTVKILEKNPQLYSELVRRDRNGGKGAAVRVMASIRRQVTIYYFKTPILIQSQ